MLTNLFRQVREFSRKSLNHIDLRQKILWGVMTVVFLGVFIAYSFYSALLVSDSALHRISNEEEPISAAAYEMAINVANSGSTVVNYMRTGDAFYQRTAQDEQVAFTNVLERYRAIANNAQEKELAEQVNVLHAQYWELGEELMLG